jgi:predicted N-acetyltransferase YhbS
VVKPDYQNKGIGKKLMQEVMKYIKNSLKDGQEVFVNLMATKGNETFYKKFGFAERPNDNVGAGMTQWVKNDE